MTTFAVPGDLVRHRIRVSGVVQGVGFRPFVHRLATDLCLAGHVGNDEDGVFIDVEGDEHLVLEFEVRLVDEAPPLARIREVSVVEGAVSGERGFRIVDSRSTGAPPRTYVSPDVAVCADCLAELRDRSDRRYRYPFTNCTNCGPRFTITRRLPYDRPNTTMAGFTMCEACAAEYSDPTDRRFHAQPIACPECGPRLWFDESFELADPLDAVSPGSTTDAALAAAQQALLDGRIVAIKGIGGYHLACDATSSDAVAELRRRKHRRDKPLAVMVADLDAARRLAVIGDREASLLESPAAPIVLLDRRSGDTPCEEVAPTSPRLGIMLPYTPLHHLLFAETPGGPRSAPLALVMTSGNLSEEPICYGDGDARRRLAEIADAWLVHDRPIHVPCDDSVVRVEEEGDLPVRRSRGYAPLPVRLPFESAPVMAVGGELKNTFCLVSGADAWMSQHIGDMGSVETLRAFERSGHQFATIYDVTPARVAADMHPGSQARRWAEGSGLAVEFVQHHHAHIVSLMAERSVPPTERVIGVAFDGTGYGRDGAIWGGEVLVAGYGDFERVTHLRYVPMVGGDATIRRPYRTALSHLWAAGIEWTQALPPVAAATGPERTALARMLETGTRCVQTSSMGRLFDAVSALVGIRQTVSYEGQAAIELEAMAAGASGDGVGYRFVLDGPDIDPGPLLAAIAYDVRRSVPVHDIAAGFHHAVALMIADVAEPLAQRSGIDQVALSGGVFQNVLLLELARSELAHRGLTVLVHRVVPPNDGGLALGQAAVAGYLAGVAAQ